MALDLQFHISSILIVMEHEDDCLAQFFTPEALLLLESINDLDSQQPTGQLGSASTVPINPSQQNGQQVSHKRESDDRSSNGLEPSPSSVQNGTATTAKRASLDPKRRAEVAELRKKGICFRCKVSKVRGGVSISFWLEFSSLIQKCLCM